MGVGCLWHCDACECLRLEEQDFNDRGVSTLDESKKFTYVLGDLRPSFLHMSSYFSGLGRQ